MAIGHEVIIVGSGHGGAQAAIALRQQKFTGPIAIVSEETGLPYERPPLSKDFLARKKTAEGLSMRSPSFWSEHSIELLTGRRVTGIKPERRVIITGKGEEIKYGSLIWAAGGHVRRLACPGHDLKGVHYVRNLADVARLHAELDRRPRIAIVGAGYIGLEVAATLSSLGHPVTVIEALDRVLARVAGEQVSRFFEAEHLARGVDLRVSAKINALEGKEGAVIAIRLTSGERIAADIVIVGIGILPEVAPLAEAGAIVSNGVRVDEYCRTSLPGVFAIGDCALHANPYADGEYVRVESVQNAHDMALAVSRVISGRSEPYRAVPWFWSNQYDLRLQTVGLSSAHTETVLRGALESKSFTIVYLRKGRVMALDCINARRDFMHGKHLIERRAIVARERLADCSIPLKQLLESPGAATALSS